MSVELLISPPASGKTKKCIQRIQNLQLAQPLAKIWTLVPDSQKAAYFRRRLADSGGGMGVHVGTFRQLYTEILERNGIFIPVITPALQHRLVQETVDAASAASELSHYNSIVRKPGFILALQDSFAELRSSLVRPDRFLEYTRDAAPARQELALLYARFLTRLEDLNWIDQEGQSWLAVSTLESNPNAAEEFRLVVVDGFTSFTGARRKFLKLLSEQVGEVLITLPGKQDSNRAVHRRGESVKKTLECELSPQVNQLTSPPRLSPDILHLEQHVLDTGISQEKETSKPILLEARSPAEEAREALRWIKSLNKREKLPLTDCAVFASNLETYQPLLRAAADEFGIQVHFSHPEPLIGSPAVQSLLNLLSLPGKNYNTRSLLNTLRSPFFDFGLDARALEDLEKVSRMASIVMGREQWEDAWDMLEESNPTVTDDEYDEERRRDDLTAGMDIPALRDAFSFFWMRFNSISEVRSQREWVAWLEKLLEGLHFYEKLSSARDLEACDSLDETLNALALSESVAGIRRVDYDQFLADLQGTLTGARLAEPKESSGNAVLVGGMIEARGSRFAAVALLGFSEGLFPAVENADPFLDEELRRDMGMEPRLGREQASIFYQAFTRADTHLLITRPYLSEDGEKWEPSPYWQAATQLFAGNALKKVSPDTPRPQADAASPQELLFWGIQQNHLQYQDDDELTSRWQALQKSRQVLNARRSKMARGEHEGCIEQIAPFLDAKFSPRQVWSASRLEEYGTCPLKFYVNSTLKLITNTPPELGLNPAQRGSILHRILELVYRDTGSNSDLQQRLEKLDGVAARVFAEAPREQGFRPSPLWEVEKVQLVEMLRQTIQALEEISADWTPIRFEQKFGKDDQPDLVIDLGSELVRLRGVIDRVDRNSQGQIRVIDYKTGSSNLSNMDLNCGRRLQLPIYALAGQEALRLGEVVEGFYWTIRDAKASSFKLSTYKNNVGEGPEAAYNIVIQHIERILSGIRSGEFPPIPPKGGCPDYCPAVQWCWRFQSR